jgi:hypothetical protein
MIRACLSNPTPDVPSHPLHTFHSTVMSKSCYEPDQVKIPYPYWNNFSDAITIFNNPEYATISDTSGSHMPLSYQWNIRDCWKLQWRMRNCPPIGIIAPNYSTDASSIRPHVHRRTFRMFCPLTIPPMPLQFVPRCTAAPSECFSLHHDIDPPPLLPPTFTTNTVPPIPLPVHYKLQWSCR